MNGPGEYIGYYGGKIGGAIAGGYVGKTPGAILGEELGGKIGMKIGKGFDEIVNENNKNVIDDYNSGINYGLSSEDSIKYSLDVNNLN